MYQDGLESDADFIESITPDVLRVLESTGFFARLDDLMLPADASVACDCSNDYELSKRVLNELSFPAEDIAEVLAVFQANGGHCDCEVLYNVAPESRLKSAYWKSKHSLEG